MPNPTPDVPEQPIPADSDGGPFFYRSGAPTKRARIAGLAAVRIAAAEQGIGCPSLQWIEETGRREARDAPEAFQAAARLGGMAQRSGENPDRVTLLASLSVPEAVIVAAHEVRHCAQPKSIRRRDRGARERDANRYARRLFARLWPILEKRLAAVPTQSG